MNLLKPDLLQALARDYALGTMTGGARRRFERLLLESPLARATLAQWQEELATLARSTPPMQPRAEVWQSLSQRLGLPGSKTAIASQPSWWQRLVSGPVLGGVAAGVLVGMVGTSVWLQNNPAALKLEPVREELPASYVGLLQDAAGKPAVLLSSRRQGRVLTAKMLQALAPPAGQVAVLWAFPKAAAGASAVPFKVGTLPASGSSKLALADTSEKLFFTVDRLGVSFEAVGSNPAAPTGPLVVQGPCVKLW
jgi:anti-sigma-K factor RskA